MKILPQYNVILNQALKISFILFLILFLLLFTLLIYQDNEWCYFEVEIQFYCLSLSWGLFYFSFAAHTQVSLNCSRAAHCQDTKDICHSFFKSIHKLSISICSTLLRHLSPTYETISINFKHIVRTGPRPSPTQKAASSDRCCILVLIMCCLTQKFTVPTFLYTRCTRVYVTQFYDENKPIVVHCCSWYDL